MDKNLILKAILYGVQTANMKELKFNHLSLTDTGEQSVH